jgi:uncharacterized protein YkwD
MLGRVLAIAVAAALCVAAIAWSDGRASQDVQGTYCANPAEMEMLSLINDFRAGHGLDPLTLSAPLGAAAEAKSEEMARLNYFQHQSPSGVTPRQLDAAHGYQFNTDIGENLAAGQETAQATFDQWRDSAPHRELMLDGDFTAIGVGRAFNVESTYDWYWTAEFGGEVGELAQPCGTPPAGTPAATPRPSGATPVHLICDGVRLADGTFDLSCRPG